MRNKNTEVVFVEVKKGGKARLRRAAELLEKDSPNRVTMSDITREALDEKLAKLARRYPELQEAAA